MSITSLPLQKIQGTSFESYLDNFKQRVNYLFNKREDINKLSLNRGLPPYMMREVMDTAPLSVFIPQEYGGRGGYVEECLQVLSAASYESLPLSLMIGINGALFLQPVSIYAQEETKSDVFSKFIKKKQMGGLMITEPDFGSDALKMTTSFEECDDHYKVKGLKHWAGLTGWADFWLITARRQNSKGELERDIEFFIHETSNGGIKVEEYYNNLGLYLIPYGRNNINMTVPKSHKLEPKTNGITMMLDILHRSRIQFPGMGLGFIKRMMDEAIAHCRDRFVGGKSLFDYDQVNARIAKMQSYFTICSAMSKYATETAVPGADLSREDLSANSIKTYVTDMMQEAAQSLLQLLGAKGYRLDSIAGRATVDSRPFQIFEGSNDILYQQVSESVIKGMKRFKSFNLKEFVSQHELTKNAAAYVHDLVSFELDPRMAQRKLVELGQVISRIISMDFVIKLGEQGFREDLIQNSIRHLRSEIDELINKYKTDSHYQAVEDYLENSSWVNYAHPSKPLHLF